MKSDSPPPFRTTLHHVVLAAQHRAALALGIDERRRGDTVLLMHENNLRRAPGYWIQLFLAMGIATLGLVLSSTAVVIGAMLVSPLMGPLVELGMGFAVGSSLLVLRATLRVLLSVTSVVAGAALFTLALPFQEVTSEIASRAAPNALDLLIAVFCALTAVYTTVRPAAESTTAAAGTAIGIALVPPLCTIGFGIGTGAANIAGGAALLFTANFSAILVVAVLSFLVLGYNQVDAAALEAEGLARHSQRPSRADRLTSRAHTILGRAFGSRYGLAMRIAIPALFLASVYIPLSNALDDVTHEVRTRSAIRRVLAAEAPGAVQTSVDVDHDAIAVRLLLVATMERAAAIEERIRSRIAALTKEAPDVSVVAVADARALEPRAVETRAPGSFDETIADLRHRVGPALVSSWPASAGTLLHWTLSVQAAAPPRLTIRQLGPPLGAAGTALLADALSMRLQSAVAVDEAPIPATPLLSGRGQERAWADSATALLLTLAPIDSIVACVTVPAAAARRGFDSTTWARLNATDVGRQGRVRNSGTGAWSLRLTPRDCASR